MRRAGLWRWTSRWRWRGRREGREDRRLDVAGVQLGAIYAGLNDLQKLFGGADPNTVLQQLGSNMTQIMCGIKATMQSQGIDPLVIVGILPDMPCLSDARPEVQGVIMLANQIISAAASDCGARVADVFTALEGREELYLQCRDFDAEGAARGG